MVPIVPLGMEVVVTDNEVVVPAEELIVNGREFVVPPDVPGTTTLTWTVPALAVSSVQVAAVSCVLLTNVVVSWVPFHCTDEPDTKPDPFTVNVSAAPPAATLLGDRALIAILGDGELAAAATAAATVIV